MIFHKKAKFNQNGYYRNMKGKRSLHIFGYLFDACIEDSEFFIF
jgi:hypothetical protein